jgi:hypothetical protein
MLQQLLVERFRLAFHWDSKEFSVYALARLPALYQLRSPNGLWSGTRIIN